MYSTFLFSFAVVFCADLRIVLTEELNVKDTTRFQPETFELVSVDSTSEVKEIHANESEFEAVAENECRCKNGKCMRKCDIVKTVPCWDDTKVCVCDPEYAKVNASVCKYCNCGQGLNCTFVDYMTFWKRNCICPKGYRIDKNTGNCIEVCSEEYPCKNGGKCLNQECLCPYGTNGAFCEEMLDCSDCVNELEVDCLYDQNLKRPFCSCKDFTLVYDYERKKCIPCPCGGGTCFYETTRNKRKLKCYCNTGYKLFNGYCKECICGYGGKCELDYRGEKICNCQEGFFEREEHCWPCRCMSYGDVDTKCEVTGTEKRCFCTEGYQDVLGHCEDIDECEVNNTCHPSVICHNTEGSFECLCPSGYEGSNGDKVKPGEVCKDINECEEKILPCTYRNFVNCVNLPGSYKCECKPGYEPSYYRTEPHLTSCIATTKSWGPALIVISISVVLSITLGCMHSRLKERAARSN